MRHRLVRWRIRAREREREITRSRQFDLMWVSVYREKERVGATPPLPPKSKWRKKNTKSETKGEGGGCRQEGAAKRTRGGENAARAFLFKKLVRQGWGGGASVGESVRCLSLYLWPHCAREVRGGGAKINEKNAACCFSLPLAVAAAAPAAHPSGRRRRGRPGGPAALGVGDHEGHVLLERGGGEEEEGEGESGEGCGSGAQKKLKRAPPPSPPVPATACRPPLPPHCPPLSPGVLRVGTQRGGGRGGGGEGLIGAAHGPPRFGGLPPSPRPFCPATASPPPRLAPRGESAHVSDRRAWWGGKRSRQRRPTRRRMEGGAARPPPFWAPPHAPRPAPTHLDVLRGQRYDEEGALVGEGGGRHIVGKL